MDLPRQTDCGDQALPSPALGRHAGFALVVALGLMAFLLVLIVSLSTLVRYEVELSATSADVQRARQNALFGLQVALGSLQEEMGPDQRISASAAILDTNPDTPAHDGVAQPYWVGSWNSLSWDRASEVDTPVSGAATASDGKPEAFRNWLVSGLNTEGMSDEQRVNLARQFTENSTGAVLLLGEGTLDTPAAAASQSVYVPREIIQSNSLTEDSYAYWVGDEGMKANFGRPTDTAATTDKEKIQATANPARPNLRAVGNWASLSDSVYDLDSIADYGAIELVTERDLDDDSAFAGKFHAVTPYSYGLLTDTRQGGFKKDLSLLFAMTNLPADYRDEPMFAADPAYGPEWEYAKRYHDRYKMLTLGDDGMPTLNVVDVIDEVDDSLVPEKPGDAPLPVVVRFQYLFSLYEGYNTNDGKELKSADSEDQSAEQNYGTNQKVVYLMVNPVLYIWNPYNVTLKMPVDNSAAFNIMASMPPLEFSFDGGTSYKPIHDILFFYGGTLIALDSSNADTSVYEGAGVELVIPPGEMRLNALGNYGTYRNHLYLDWPDKRDYFAMPQAQVIAPNRNPTLSNVYDEGALGLFSQTIMTGTEKKSPDTKLPASSFGGEVKVRFNPNASKFIFKVNIGTEGSGARKQAGAFEVDANSPISSTVFPEEVSFEISHLEDMLTGGNFRGQEPFLVLNYDVRSFEELEGFGKAGLFTDPANAYFYSVDADEKALATMPFRISFEEFDAGTDYVQYDESTGKATIRVINMENGSIQLIDKNVAKEIPVSPMLSIAQLEHAPLGRDYRQLVYQFDAFDSDHTPPGSLFGGDPEKRNMAPVFNRAVGNSFSHPMIAEDSVWDGAYAMDRSYFLNDVLFDGYFFSGLADDGGPYAPAVPLSAEEHLDAFLTGTETLPNPAYELHIPDGVTAAEVVDDITDDPTRAFERLAAFLYVHGAFNVNSTSIDAWAAVLSSLRDQAVQYTDPDSGVLLEYDSTGSTPVLANMLPSAPAAEDQTSVASARDALWSGFRTLSDAQIQALAEEIVTQVKARGPFLSLGQFVNREISDRDAYNKTGALQAAIDASGLNTSSENASLNSALNERFNSNAMSEAAINAAGFVSPQSLYGDRNEGMPGYMTQADLLKPIAPTLTARSDTFIIRAYGDVRNGDAIISKAWCEAVVQRCPDYVEGSVEAWETPVAGTIDDTLGRRFRVISFRWLGEDEV